MKVTRSEKGRRTVGSVSCVNYPDEHRAEPGTEVVYCFPTSMTLGLNILYPTKANKHLRFWGFLFLSTRNDADARALHVEF